MATIGYAIMFLFLLAVLAITCFININEIDKQINNILAEEKRQNKRIDIMEKREQMRQLEQLKDQTYIQSKDLFKEWQTIGGLSMIVTIHNIKYNDTIVFDIEELTEESRQDILLQVHARGWHDKDLWSEVD